MNGETTNQSNILKAEERHMPNLAALHWIQGQPPSVGEDASSRSGDDKWSLALLWQVNCAGCHTHALPILAQFAKATNLCHVYAISTAFEDFDLNTLQNTQRFLRDGSLVGEARRALGRDKAPNIFSGIAMAFDTLLDPKKDKAVAVAALDTTRAVTKEQLLQMGLPPDQMQSALDRLTTAMLPPKIAETFYAVAAAGTPTWILHDSRGKVRATRLGGLTLELLNEWVTAETEKARLEKEGEEKKALSR